MFGMSLVITISLVGMVWFNSFETKLYVMMGNQPPGAETTYLAKSEENIPSLFASISGIFGNMKAAIVELMGFFGEVKNTPEDSNDANGKVYEFPLSGEK